jgi:hypothetical protein
VHIRRIARAEIPEGEDFRRWMDDQWLAVDAATTGDDAAPRVASAGAP